MADPIEEHRRLLAWVEESEPLVRDAAELLVAAYAAGGGVLAFGNGGSAGDAQHLAAELVGRYRRERRPLKASSLATDPSVVTCIANDYAFDEVFARQVRAAAGADDVVVGFTTSGRSPNVVAGLAAAKELGATTLLFSGNGGGPAADHADVALVVPSEATARIQEMHLLLVHLVMEPVDAWAAGERA